MRAIAMALPALMAMALCTVPLAASAADLPALTTPYTDSRGITCDTYIHPDPKVEQRVQDIVSGFVEGYIYGALNAYQIEKSPLAARLDRRVDGSQVFFDMHRICFEARPGTKVSDVAAYLLLKLLKP